MGAIATSLFLVSAIFAQKTAPPPSKDKLSSEVEAAGKVRDEAIQKEIKTLGDHPWAGSYSLVGVELLNHSIVVAPSNGFAFQLRGCFLVEDRNFGDVIQTARGTLKLDPKYSWTVEKEFLPFTWGQRRYLIELNAIGRFCDSVRLKSEPYIDMQVAYYLRRGDHEKPAGGDPVLPQQFGQTCEDLVKRSNPHDALAGFLAAFERLEWDKFCSYIAEDACVIHPSSENPARICGKAEVEASFQKVFEQVRQLSSGPVFMELLPERLHIQMLSEDAAVTSFELSNDQRFGRRSIAWQKQETGTWKIVHLHASSMTKAPD